MAPATSATSFTVSGILGSPPNSPNAGGVYNVAFLAKDKGNPSNTDTAVFQFVISPPMGALQVNVTSATVNNQVLATGGPLWPSSQVLPLRFSDQPYSAQITASSMAGAATISAANVVRLGSTGGVVPATLPGLNIAGVGTNTVSLSGPVTQSVGESVFLQVMASDCVSSITQYFNFAIAHSPQQDKALSLPT